jgi:hypothetical protein
MEVAMSGDQVRDEIAFIRHAVGDGRDYVLSRSWDFVIWGVAIAVMYLGIYAKIRRWWDVDITTIALICTNVPWLYSLRGFFLGSRREVPPMARALGMLWIGCGITLSTLANILMYTGEMRGSFAATTAGIMGIGFFASSYLCNLAWMRWVAVGWWAAEFATFALRDQPEVLLLAAALMFFLLALPGMVLQLSRPTLAAA